MLNRNRLLAKLVENGMRQADLADAIGMSSNTLNAKLNGKSCFSIDEAQRVCIILQIRNPVAQAEIFFAGESQT